jgi:hypothetical protein
MKEAVVTLDSEAAVTAKHLADAWGVSVEEAVRRALRSAAASGTAASRQARIQAFLELSRSLNLDEAKAKAWMDLIRDARR